MKITVVNGSPRGDKSNTYKMLEVLFDVVKTRNYELNYIDLSKKKIHHCLGCFACWLKTPGKCVISDDMDGILDGIKDSDYIFFASPLYVDNVSGLMKNFLDRQIPLAHPKFDRDENGEAVHFRRYNTGKKVKIVAISNSGFPEMSHFETLRVIYRRMARNMKADLVAEIYRTQGPLLEINQFFLKIMIRPYYSNLKKAYNEIFDNGRISYNTQEKLDKPMISVDTYYERANKHFDELLEKVQEK